MKVSIALRSLAAALMLAGLAGLAAPAGAQVPSIGGILIEPPNPTVADTVELVVYGYQTSECRAVVGKPAYDPDRSVFQVPVIDPECSASPAEPFETRYSLGKLAAGSYRAEIRRDRQPALSQEQFQVSNVDPSAALQHGLFVATVEWRNQRDGSTGIGYAAQLTDESVAFWFFDPDNVEITLKVLDGRPVNGHWWVFLASMTDLEVKVTVLEDLDDCLLLPVVPPACPTRVYRQEAGKNRNFLDTQAFAE